MNNSKRYLLCYGTLRRNAARNYNFQRFGPQHYVGDYWIYGYNLHSLGSYPAAVKGVGNIFCELHEVEEKTEESITLMERSAGYEVHQVEVLHPKQGLVSASLYAFPVGPMVALSQGKIDSGDWNELQDQLAR